MAKVADLLPIYNRWPTAFHQGTILLICITFNANVMDK